MANIKKILQQTATPLAGGNNKALSGKGLGGAGIKELTQRVDAFGKAVSKAYSKNNAKNISAVFKSMEQAKTLNQEMKKLADKQKELAKLTNKPLNLITADDHKNIKKYAEEITDLEGNVKDLTKALKESTAGPLQKGMMKLGETLSNKYVKFASLATAGALAAKTFKNFDRTSVYLQESLKQLPIEEQAKAWDKHSGSLRKVGQASDSLVGSLVDMYSGVKESLNIRSSFSDIVVESKKFDTQLNTMTITTGKTKEELQELAVDVMGTFRLSMANSRNEILQTTQNVSLLGSALGIGTAEAFERVRQRSQDMGVSLRDAQREMSGIAVAASDLQHGELKLQMSTKQYADMVYRSVDADTRASQNMRIKNQLISNTISLLMKQGKTQKEATAAAEQTVGSLMKSNQMIERSAGIDLAEKMDKAIRGGPEAQAAYLAEMTKGMDPEAAAKKQTELRAIMDRNKGGIRDKFSTGGLLMNSLGSQQSGIEARLAQLNQKYGNIKDDSIYEQLVQGGAAESYDSAIALVDQMRAYQNGTLDFSKIQKKESTENLEKQGNLIASAGDLGNRISNAKDALMDNTLVTAIGALTAGAAALAGFVSLNSIATAANTAAMGGKGMMDTAMGGLGKIPGIGALGKGLKVGGKALGKFGGIGTALFGAYEYATAKDQEEKNQAVKGLGGAATGAVIGGVIGSFVPVLGTAVGASVGSIVGDMAARYIPDNALGMSGNQPTAKAQGPGSVPQVPQQYMPPTTIPPQSSQPAVPGSATILNADFERRDTDGGFILKINGGDEMVMSSLAGVKGRR